MPVASVIALDRLVLDAEVEAARTWPRHSSCASPSMKKVRPIVAMNSVICGWLTSGRSTTRSVARPSTTITPSVEHEREPEVDAAVSLQRRRR